MGLIVNWNGDTVSSEDSSALWSFRGANFTSKIGVKTYFPLPMKYSSAVPVIGKYTVTASTKDRADLIARELYGSEEYWWLVYWINGIIDPFASLNVGDTLLIADISVITSMVR
jgi:hypothetical protein